MLKRPDSDLELCHRNISLRGIWKTKLLLCSFVTIPVIFSGILFYQLFPHFNILLFRSDDIPWIYRYAHLFTPHHLKKTRKKQKKDNKTFLFMLLHHSQFPFNVPQNNLHLLSLFPRSAPLSPTLWHFAICFLFSTSYKILFLSVSISWSPVKPRGCVLGSEPHSKSSHLGDTHQRNDVRFFFTRQKWSGIKMLQSIGFLYTYAQVSLYHWILSFRR